MFYIHILKGNRMTNYVVMEWHSLSVYKISTQPSACISNSKQRGQANTYTHTASYYPLPRPSSQFIHIHIPLKVRVNVPKNNIIDDYYHCCFYQIFHRHVIIMYIIFYLQNLLNKVNLGIGIFWHLFMHWVRLCRSCWWLMCVGFRYNTNLSEYRYSTTLLVYSPEIIRYRFDFQNEKGSASKRPCSLIKCILDAYLKIQLYKRDIQVIVKMDTASQDGKYWRKERLLAEPLNLSKHKLDQPTSVKQTLKSLIKSRRIAEGKDELQVEFHVEKTRCEVK